MKEQVISELFAVYYDDGKNQGWVGHNLINGSCMPALCYPKENAEQFCINENYKVKKVRLVGVMEED